MIMKVQLPAPNPPTTAPVIGADPAALELPLILPKDEPESVIFVERTVELEDVEFVTFAGW